MVTSYGKSYVKQYAREQIAQQTQSPTAGVNV